MRKLIFDVDQQKITRNRECDFDHIVAGTEGYLAVEFNFSEAEWGDCDTIIARFWGAAGKEHAVIVNENPCYVPTEVLYSGYFELSLVGVKKDYRITTNKVKVVQEVYG